MTRLVILKVFSRLLALRIARTIKAIVVLDTKFVIRIVNLDILRDFALLYLKVILLLDEQLHSVSPILDGLRVREAHNQGVLHLLHQVREFSLVDFILKLEYLLWHSKRQVLHQKLLWVYIWP